MFLYGGSPAGDLPKSVIFGRGSGALKAMRTFRGISRSINLQNELSLMLRSNGEELIGQTQGETENFPWSILTVKKPRGCGTDVLLDNEGVILDGLGMPSQFVCGCCRGVPVTISTGLSLSHRS